MAEQAASSTGQSASSTASSSKCAPVCLNSTLLHESVHLLKFLETLLGLPVSQPLKPSWNLHWSELVNVFTHTPAVSAVSKEEGWDSEAEAEEVNAVCAVKQIKGEKREGTSSSWSYNSYSWPISLPHCHSFICTRSFESEPYRGEVTKINLEYRTMDGQWFLAFRKYEICPTGAWDLWTIFQTQGVFNCGTCVCILKWSWGLRTRSVPEWQQYITV